MKLPFLLIIVSLVFMSYAQNTQLKGQFTGKKLEKSFINVINISQSKTTISQLDGKFEIEAKSGDSIIVSSIQYKKIKFVVKPEFFDKGIEIPLKLKINELDQINLYSIGLTGNLKTDAKNIKLNKPSTADFGTFDVSKVYDDEVTIQSEFSFRNDAMVQNPIPASVDFKAVFRLVGKLFKKRQNNSTSARTSVEQLDRLEDVDFFVNTLKIEEEQIVHFLSYAKTNGLTTEMLRQSNELDLMQFLINISENFKAEYGN